MDENYENYVTETNLDNFDLDSDSGRLLHKPTKHALNQMKIRGNINYNIKQTE